ncbi:MAG: cytidine deaminase [bacterium]|jgi:cytidine deaminase
MDDAGLIREAARARGNAHAPYSGAMVGACVETADGEIFSACNVENASYGLTICAERAAIFAAVAAGHRRIAKVAISAEGLENPLPCGACLQVMKEFAVERVLIDRGDGKFDSYEFSELLPLPFEL